MRTRLLVALIAGALLPQAYAPFDHFWVAPLSYALLFLLWNGLRPAQALSVGFAFGCAAFLAGVHWVYVSIHDYGLAHPLLASAITLALVVYLGAYVGLAGWIASRWFPSRGPAAWLAVFPAMTLLTEWCRGWVLSGFGWLAAGYSQTDSWLMGYAPLGGVYLMTWAVLVTAGALPTLAFGRWRLRIAAATGLALLWGGGYLLGNVRFSEASGNVITAALVQGAVPQELKWRPEQLPVTLDLYRRLTEEAGDSRLIVWPEAAIPALYAQAERYLEEIRDGVRARGGEVALGILRDDPDGGGVQNTLVVLGPEPAFYVKRHLVPYGEYFPVPGFVRRWLRLLSLPYTDTVPGDPDQAPLAIAGERVGVSICYEDLFGAEQRQHLPEATLLVNVSNDAWFGDTVAPHQHLQIARVRAAEASRYLLRSTNTGITAFIDPRGRIVARAPAFEPHVLRGAVQGFSGRTPYAFWGDYLAVTGAFLVLVVCVVRRSGFRPRS